MAKQARDGDSVESGFDFSRFLDLEENTELEPSTDTGGFDYDTIPHSRDEIVTGALEDDLEGSIESYIKAGRVSWGDKRSLRRLATENRELEAGLKDADAAILERADGYHTIVSNILREKNDHEGFALDDSDPYDTETADRAEESLGSRAARAQSSDLFKEISKLEQHRAELNGRRIDLLEEIRAFALKSENDELDALEAAIDGKLEAIGKVQDITKSNFSPEDEALFDHGVDELTGYISGTFDPLAEEDEYDEEADIEETPLSYDGHSEEEIAAIRRVTLAQESVAAPSFAELFTGDADEEEDSEKENPEDDSTEEEGFGGYFDGFSSAESPSDLDEALGEGYSEEVEGSDELTDRLIEESTALPTDESNEAELLYEDAEGDLSVAANEFEGHSAEGEIVAEDAAWGQEDHHGALDDHESYAGASELELHQEDSVAESEPVEHDRAFDELPVIDVDYGDAEEQRALEIATVAFDPFAISEIDTRGVTVRTVIFDELKLKYGMSFEGVPGLED